MFARQFFVRLIGILLFLPLLSTSQAHGRQNGHHEHSRVGQSQWNDHVQERPSIKYSKEAHEPKEEENLLVQTLTDSGTVKPDVKQPTTTAWLEALCSLFLISFAPIIILFFIPLDNTPECQPALKIILSFASGCLVSNALIHLIPHALMAQSECERCGHSQFRGHSHEDGESHGHFKTVGMWVLCVLVIFWIVEKFFRIIKDFSEYRHAALKEDRNEESSKTKRKGNSSEKDEGDVEPTQTSSEIKVAGYLNLAADFIRNYKDGLAIGAYFWAGPYVGIGISFMVLLHEVLHKIGDFSTLIRSGWDHRKAIFLELITTLFFLIGCSISLLVGGIDSAAVAWIVPFTAGGFICLGCASIMNELLEGSYLTQAFKGVIAFFFGIYMMFLVDHE